MRYAPEHDGIAQRQAFDALAGWLSMRRGMKVGRSDAAAFEGSGRCNSHA